jgi:hypothetical protein
MQMESSPGSRVPGMDQEMFQLCFSDYKVSSMNSSKLICLSLDLNLCYRYFVGSSLILLGSVDYCLVNFEKKFFIWLWSLPLSLLFLNFNYNIRLCFFWLTDFEYFVAVIVSLN